MEFYCTNCGSTLKVEDRNQGKTVDCPHCGKPTAVPHAEGTPTSAYARPGFVKCPYCQTEIPANSTLCRKCGGKLQGNLPPGGYPPNNFMLEKENKKRSNEAIFILICGLLGCFAPVVAIYGTITLLKHKDYPNRTLAIIGTVLAWIWTLITLMIVISGIAS
ncbi:MAG: hypothetical protein K8T10_05140 [Candidatus Eremiobacteraeota bacterium]|nr:hypothetical protein [Candidatus Eremiobacteraeota bacterium]